MFEKLDLSNQKAYSAVRAVAIAARVFITAPLPDSSTKSWTSSPAKSYIAEAPFRAYIRPVVAV